MIDNIDTITTSNASDFTGSGTGDYNNKTSAKSLLIGRDKEISKIVDYIKNNKSNSSWLLTGESGIGKSALLDKLYTNLVNDKDNGSDNIFVGYYSKNQSLIAEAPQSITYPFNIVLSSLIKGAHDTQRFEEKADITINRLKKTLVGFTKEEGTKIVGAIINDVAKKAGLEETFKVAKSFQSKFKSEKTSFDLAEDYIANHKEVLNSYIRIFNALAEEFKERQFVLIFDQFEYVGKASVDLLLNFKASST